MPCPAGRFNNYRAQLSISDSVFDNNRAVGTNYWGYGGAIGVNSHNPTLYEYTGRNINGNEFHDTETASPLLEEVSVSVAIPGGICLIAAGDKSL